MTRLTDEEKRARKAAAQAAYKKTPEGKAMVAKHNAAYRKSPKGEATIAAYRKSPKGVATNAKHHAKHNAKHNAKNKKERQEAAVKWHQENSIIPPLTIPQVDEVVTRIINSVDIGGLGTLSAMSVVDKSFTFYVGLTKQADVKLEDLRWLTARGANLSEGETYTGRRNRPVLLWPDDRVRVSNIITMKEAREDIGFHSQVVYEAGALIDASRVEDEIQTRFQSLPLGRKRLWRHVAMGRSSNKKDATEPQVYKVFITYSTKVMNLLDSNEIIIQT